MEGENMELVKGGQGRSLVGDVAYHDYVAMFCYMDAEWSRRRIPADETMPDVCTQKKGEIGHFLWAHKKFRESCEKFKEGIKKNYGLFSTANHTEPKEKIATFLFNPICYHPFGHADDMAIVLLDDFDPVHRLTAEIETTVEEVCLALCPKIATIIDDSGGPFCELHNLPEGNPLEHLTHKFQQKTPLVAFTKYKMDGLATLGQGLLFQQSLFKTMAQKVRLTVDVLREKIRHDTVVGALMRQDDIDTVKCAFVDLQSAEEIGTLIFCRNYSVALTIVAALRSLTFGEVLKGSEMLKDLLNRSEMHQRIIKESSKLQKEEPSGHVGFLGDNHVFRWTRTSLAVSPDAFIDPVRIVCNGYVEAYSGVQIAPGHEGCVEEGFASISDIGAPKVLKDGQYHRCHMGEHDFIFHYRPSDSQRNGSLVPMSSVVSLVNDNFHKFGRIANERDHGRDVVDIATSMTIPVPKLEVDGMDIVCGSVGDKHLGALEDVLPRVQRRLCYYTVVYRRKIRQSLEVVPVGWTWLS